MSHHRGSTDLIHFVNTAITLPALSNTLPNITVKNGIEKCWPKSCT